MVSSSSLCKNKEVLARNGGEKWNQHHCRVGSMSLLNMALVCIRVGLGIYHLIFSLASMGLGDPFWPLIHSFPRHHDLWSINVKYFQTHCRAIYMFKRSWPLQVSTYLWFSSAHDSQKHYVPLSRVDDVGNTMAHLRSRSLPVDFSSLSRKLI